MSTGKPTLPAAIACNPPCEASTCRVNGCLKMRSEMARQNELAIFNSTNQHMAQGGKMKKDQNLSKRAQKLLERIKRGAWYYAYSETTPKSMQELVDAGLVQIAGRVAVIRAAYVPATGYTDFVMEKFEVEK